MIPLSEAETLAWEVFLVVGLVPPLAVWLLWRAQRLSVEVLRRAMVGLTRRSRWLYHSVSWTGTFLHELSHAIVLVATGLGVKDWSVRSEEGHVTPRRRPDSTLAAIAMITAAMAPMFFVPALLLVAAILLMDPDLLAWGTPAFGVGAMDAITESLLEFPRRFGNVMLLPESKGWAYAVFMAFVLLGAPGTRPSFIRGRGLLGGQGDIGVVRQTIRRRPWIAFIVPAAVLVGYYAILPLWPAVYWWPFQALWATAITGILAALFAAVFWGSVAANTRITPWAIWVPAAFAVAVAMAGRLIPFLARADLAGIDLLAFATWVLSAWLLGWAWPRRDHIDRAIA